MQTSIDEGIDEDSEKTGKKLIAKLAEYKPLAKIEELEEQNYNMIDDRLNNGVEKFNREEEKKEQREKPQARTSSLKERLAAKQKEATQGNNKGYEGTGKTQKIHIGRCRMMNKFTVEEINFMCVFETQNRMKMMEKIRRIMPYIKDSDMEDLSRQVLRKLDGMTDKEFLKISF